MRVPGRVDGLRAKTLCSERVILRPAKRSEERRWGAILCSKGERRSRSSGCQWWAMEGGASVCAGR